MTKVSDEMLMAYADGELDTAAAADIRRVVAADPDLERRLQLFVRVRRQAKEVYAPVLEEAVPDRLITAIRRPDAPQPVRRWYDRLWLPLGAAALAAIGGFLVGANLREGGTGPFTPFADVIASTLEKTPSGQVVRSNGLEIEVAGTYEAAETYCRVFRARLADAGWRGVACRHDGGWSTDLIVADGGPVGSFGPASDLAVQSIEAFLDAGGAGGALSEPAERDVMSRAWSRKGPAQPE